MRAVFTLRFVFLLEDETRTSFPGLVTINREPEHCVFLGLIGVTLMSKVDTFCDLANSMMTISVEISKSNLMFVMMLMTTTVAMITIDQYFVITRVQQRVHCRTN